MENHDFSDPLPYPQGSIQPCWKVHVYRRGVPEPVASLEVHAQSLPPRLGKKSKVLWKLPDRLEDTPRFGGLEKERLWQLFKREKKNRRKSNKQQQPQPPPPTATSDADAAPISSSLENDPKAPPPPQEIQEKIDQVADKNDDDDDDKPASSSSALPPPPGFGRGQASPNDDQEDEPDGANPPSPAATTPSSSTAGAASAAPPGLSSPDAAATTTTAPPPPPPPPPGLSSPPPPSAPPSSSGFVFGSLQGSDILTLPHHVLAQVIGHVLAQFFISCVTTPGHLAQWLAKYHASALKLLLFGTAQAQAQTPADRQQQWESLLYNPHPHHNNNNNNNNNNNTSTGESSSQQAAAAPPITTTTTTMTPWDCQGWAVQPLLRMGPPLHDNSLEGLLVVLTGRTVQQGEVLTYHLTLTLRPLTTMSGTGGTPFHITNEILSLTRATPPPSSS